jgi:alanyl-tRNA synthetase
MESQRTKARAQSAFKGGAAKDAAWTASEATRAALEQTGEAVFRGYDRTSLNTQVLALFDDARAEVPSLTAGQTGFAILRETPFYLEAGGQVSDVGTISAPGGAARVTGVVRAASGRAPTRWRSPRARSRRGIW